ncbi:sulfonate ABC transporter substrate-binding protein [Aetokthonos hydrillicola Thurmond2011]|jgi:sulfonate transport system substrate-binding protein|uniref:Putative aliphatic sulfonates-binding protein n=1 Tax=Aetokthonos hydrillicola Thurmond2011 TaxID=2712845 RepID=A0AAP5IC19_9CYAN|nr:sulfonate ABC transporter substrate-binding protein [Aetokthonos hydrillicola]MBO3464271.1 sulfonate ABC transporter substrate-binding protein [Aetokthonos hydrillicola CCALA 1050]MBW4589871.1 sulfonate ABC transporter substrate-binding protein [Aetokthonos hydrillicola CCALA 1050]MDR9896953.1 sulfonate ABC transporter substrate-binding protein [Aetokthonos hydrillicola Thurmond2011]
MFKKFLLVRLLGIFSGFFYIRKLSRVRIFALLFSLGLGLSLTLSACSTSTSNSATTQTADQKGVVVRIGYQKAATILYSLKAKKDLEKALPGAIVKWTEFPAGPPMLEAMNAGSIDFGYTGESPPIFAQAAGNPLVYVAYDPWTPKAEAIIVPKNSPVKTVAELKGKRVAFAKGSNTNYLLVKALEKAGLKYDDIKPVTLPPPDARAAFEGNNVEAWAIWDPYLAAAVASTGARTLTDGTGLVPNRGYYLAAKSFVEKHPDTVKILLDQVKTTSDWAQKNPREVAQSLSPVLGIDAAVLEVAERRREYGVLPITDEVIAGQQQIADAFYKIKLLNKQINVKDAVWKSS